METYNPEYVLILGGDHIYKMDYEMLLDFHKSNNADITLATYPVSWEEASRFGLVITDENKQVVDFEEKPPKPRSNLASMGIYIFTWKVLRDALIELSEQPGCDFGKHIIPYCHKNGARIFAYEYNGYWKDVGTLAAYWESNMELIDLVPEFNLYEEFWRIYTKSTEIPPLYIASSGVVSRSIVGEGCEIYGEVYNSVISPGVIIEEGAVVSDSIIMNKCTIGRNSKLYKVIMAENGKVGSNCELGVGEEKENKSHPNIYCNGLVTLGEATVIPDNVRIGKNTVISGITTPEDYPNNWLDGGECLIKGGVNR
jgi:glucose-1-phosphate adenylyltransferase